MRSYFLISFLHRHVRTSARKSNKSLKLSQANAFQLHHRHL